MLSIEVDTYTDVCLGYDCEFLRYLFEVFKHCSSAVGTSWNDIND